MKSNYFLGRAIAAILFLLSFNARCQVNFSWTPAVLYSNQPCTLTYSGSASQVSWYLYENLPTSVDLPSAVLVGSGNIAMITFPVSGNYMVMSVADGDSSTTWLVINEELGSPKIGFGEQACNIISNYSFENYTLKPSSFSQIGRALGWYDARDNYATSQTPVANDYVFSHAGTSDFFHRDYNYTPSDPSYVVDVPLNFKGTQEPSSFYGTGSGYTGIFTYTKSVTASNWSSNNYSEYLIQKLNTAMTGGKTYTVKFFVSLADGAKYATRIGALFSANEPSRWNQGEKLSQTSGTFTPYVPQVISAGPVTDAHGWTLIEGTVTVPVGQTFNYITIGNFEHGPTTLKTLNPGYNDNFASSDGNYLIRQNSMNDVPATHLTVYESSYYYIDEVTVIPSTCCITDKNFGTDINSITYTSQLNLSIGQSASIHGNLVVNTPVFTFYDNNIKFAPGSKITVPSGTKLQVTNGSVLEACTDMWQGIDCAGEIFFSNSTIKDAHSALNFVSTSKWSIQFSVLENNRRHIYVNGGNSFPLFATTNIIRSNKLRCNPAQMKSPYAGQYTYHAVEVVNVGSFEFGKIDVAGVRNEVSHAFRGIYANNVYKLDVYNNHFENIKCYAPVGVACGKGTDYNVAIYATGDKLAAAPTIVNVGALANTMAKNTFNNCTGGVYTQNNAGGIVAGNDFSYIRDYAIFSQNNKYANNGIVCYDNYIRHAKVGIYVYDNGNNTLWVLQNTITKISDFNSVPTYGIRIENPLRPSVPNKVNVSNNTVTRYRFGIYLNQTNRPYLNGNQVNTHATLTDYPEGIRVDNSGAGDILENNIREFASAGQSIGIRVEYSPGMSTICNNIYNNHIGMFFGGEQPASRVGANYMHNGKSGIHINYGNIGPQGVGKIPHMNAWVGSTWTSHLHNTASSMTGHGDNSQFALKYPGTVFNPQPFLKTRNSGGPWPLVSTLPLQNNNSIPMFVTSCRGNLDNPDGIVEILFSDTLTLSDSTLYKEEIAWTKEMMLYRAVKEDTTGTLDDALYQYKASLDYTTKGILDQSKEDAIVGDFGEAMSKLGAINPTQAIEAKTKDVYALAYGLLSVADSLATLSDADSLLLNALALECPYQYGEAVYSARNLLLMYHPYALFANACEGVDWGLEKSATKKPVLELVSLAKIYPNPSSDDFVVLFENIQEAAGAEVVVTDINGRTRGTYFIYRDADMILILGHALEAGIYICTIKIHGEVKETIKIEKL